MKTSSTTVQHQTHLSYDKFRNLFRRQILHGVGTYTNASLLLDRHTTLLDGAIITVIVGFERSTVNYFQTPARCRTTLLNKKQDNIYYDI